MASTYIKFAAKYINKDEKKLANINGVILVIYIIFAGIAITIGSILIFFLRDIFTNFSNSEIEDMQIMLAIMLINIAAVSISGLFESYIILNERFVFQKCFLIIKKILVPIITIPLLIIGYKNIMVITITALVNIISLIANIRYSRKKLDIKIEFKKVERKLLTEIFVFYTFVFMTVIIDQINWSIDSIIIGIKRNSEDVAIYTIASQINSIYMTLATTVSGVFVPQIHLIVNKNETEEEKNEELSQLMIKTGRIQCMVIFLILFGFIFFRKTIYYIIIWKRIRISVFSNIIINNSNYICTYKRKFIGNI